MKRTLLLICTLVCSVSTWLHFGSAHAEAAPSAVTTTTTGAGDPTLQATTQVDSIVLGAGCFWGAEKRYAAIPGVLDAVSGYAGGQGIRPEYNVITQARYRMDPNNHAEVVQVRFDPAKVSLRELLMRYFESHDPTQGNRQGNDVGTQYRSIILIQNPSQATLAQSVLAQYQQALSKAGLGKITTEIKPLVQFFPAEDYHQDYLVKNPNGYCPDHSTGVKFAPDPALSNIDNRALLKGKHILVLEADGFCPYCEKFRREVSENYRGEVPLHYRNASGLRGLSLKTPTWATPTLYFLADGKEVLAHQGYVDAKQFEQALAAFTAGDAKAFALAVKRTR